MTMRRARGLLLSWTISYLVFSIAGGITLAELQLHPWRRPLLNNEYATEIVRNRYGVELQNVGITAVDGAGLHAWYIRPKHGNGRDILLLPEVQDNREGVAGF